MDTPQDSARPAEDGSEGSRRTQFRKGQSGNPGGKPKQADDGVAPPLLLRDMRRVYQTDASKDRTPAQRRLRKLLEDDFKSFTSQMAGLEKQWLATQAALPDVPKADEEEVDEGTEAALALAERWLREHGAKSE